MKTTSKPRSKTTSKATPTSGTTPRAVKLRNVVCPRCDGPIYSCPVRWLFCLGCSKPSAKRTAPLTMATRTERPIPFTLATPMEAAA